MKQFRFRIIAYLVFALAIMGSLVACTRSGGQQSQNNNTVQIYYLDREETKLVVQEYVPQSTEKEKMVAELLNKLKEEPKEKELEPTIRSDIELLNVQVEEDGLNINFGDKYKELSVATEILVRAGVVRTLTQIEGISYVSFSINGISLTDASGQAVGLMQSDFFIDNAGSEINAYEQAELKLYFSNAEGTGLVPVSRTVRYNTNISMEKLVMEQLIAGPVSQESYPTMNPETKIINVTVKDGICYVNLSSDFLTSVYSVNSEVTIYSITNTLTALNNVNKVQILVEGESKVTFREDVDLQNVFSRNLDIIVNKNEN